MHSPTLSEMSGHLFHGLVGLFQRSVTHQAARLPRERATLVMLGRFKAVVWSDRALFFDAEPSRASVRAAIGLGAPEPGRAWRSQPTRSLSAALRPLALTGRARPRRGAL